MKNRTHITDLRKHFIKVPSKILNIGLDPASICIYLALCDYSEDYNPTLTKLSRHTGLHRNTVCRCLKRLCETNVITKIVQGKVFRVTGTQSPNTESFQSVYEFNSPKSWVTNSGKSKLSHV